MSGSGFFGVIYPLNNLAVSLVLWFLTTLIIL